MHTVSILESLIERAVDDDLQSSKWDHGNLASLIIYSLDVMRKKIYVMIK